MEKALVNFDYGQIKEDGLYGVRYVARRMPNEWMEQVVIYDRKNKTGINLWAEAFSNSIPSGMTDEPIIDPLEEQDIKTLEDYLTGIKKPVGQKRVKPTQEDIKSIYITELDGKKYSQLRKYIVQLSELRKKFHGKDLQIRFKIRDLLPLKREQDF